MSTVPRVGFGPTRHGFSVSLEPCREEWRPVVGCDGRYEVSDLGRVRRSAPGRATYVGKILKQSRSSQGYAIACLSGGKGKARRWVETHLLVSRAFMGPPPDGLEVDHLDRDPGNPRLANLEYVTRAENNARRACGVCREPGHDKRTCGTVRQGRWRHLPRPNAAEASS